MYFSTFWGFRFVALDNTKKGRSISPQRIATCRPAKQLACKPFPQRWNVAAIPNVCHPCIPFDQKLVLSIWQVHHVAYLIVHLQSTWWSAATSCTLQPAQHHFRPALLFFLSRTFTISMDFHLESLHPLREPFKNRQITVRGLSYVTH